MLRQRLFHPEAAQLGHGDALLGRGLGASRAVLDVRFDICGRFKVRPAQGEGGLRLFSTP